MSSLAATKTKNEPCKPMESVVFVWSVFLGADASNRVQYCGPGIFRRRDVSRECGACEHANEGRVRNIRIVLFGVHISGRVAQCGGSRSVYDLWFGAVPPEFSGLCLAVVAQQSSAGAWSGGSADAVVGLAVLDCACAGFAHRSGTGAGLRNSADGFVCTANVLYAAQTGPGGEIFSGVLPSFPARLLAVIASLNAVRAVRGLQ